MPSPETVLLNLKVRINEGREGSIDFGALKNSCKSENVRVLFELNISLNKFCCQYRLILDCWWFIVFWFCWERWWDF